MVAGGERRGARVVQEQKMVPKQVGILLETLSFGSYRRLTTRHPAVQDAEYRGGLEVVCPSALSDTRRGAYLAIALERRASLRCQVNEGLVAPIDLG